MRKVGTISSAVGFIFLGVWMIINQRDAILATNMFKWWPIIIIILGIEILLGLGNSSEDHRMKLSGLIIPVILLFLFVNIFMEAKIKIGDGINWIKGSGGLNELTDLLKNIDDENYKIIESSKVIEVNGKIFSLYTSNGDITVRTATDGKIKIDSKVYVKKSNNQSTYVIKENKESDGYKVSFDEGFIKKVRIDLYVPDGTDLKFSGNNVKIVSSEQRYESKINIDIRNGLIDLKSIAAINIKTDNSKINIVDINDVIINGSNASINITGKTENLDIDVNNAVVSVENEQCKNINVKVNSGTVKLDTKESDVQVILDINHGPCALNGEKRINGGISKSLGDGKGKVKIEVNNGMISFNN